MKQLMIWIACLCSTMALANDKKKKQQEEDDRVYINIPEHLRNRGYSLKFDREVIPLKGKRVESPDAAWYQRLYLLDSNNRIVYADKTYPDERALIGMEPDNMRVGLYWGTTVIHGEAFDDAFVADPLSLFAVEYIYQPGPLGFMLNATSISTEHSTSFGNSQLRTAYDESQTRIGITYDTAPFAMDSGIMSLTHIMYYGGALTSHTTISITDDVVTIEDEDDQNGAFAGVELRWPVFGAWFSARLDYSYHQAKFNKFSLDNHAVQRNGIFGVSYAF